METICDFIVLIVLMRHKLSVILRYCSAILHGKKKIYICHKVAFLYDQQRYCYFTLNEKPKRN